MRFQKRGGRSSTVGGFFNLESSDRRSKVFGFGEGDYIRLRDEFGRVWRGSAETLSDNSVRFSFTDEDGHRITGLSDTYGVTLRDERGKTWRGFID